MYIYIYMYTYVHVHDGTKVERWYLKLPIVQDAFQQMPCLISCAGVTGCEGVIILCHVHV